MPAPLHGQVAVTTSTGFPLEPQYVRDMEIVGTGSATGGIRFFSTRWCGVERCYFRNFSGAGVAGVLIDGNAVSQYPNYFNRVSNCHFDTMPYGVYLRGEATAGTGANSNVVEECTFGNCTTNGVIIDGGDTNTVRKCEFATGTGTGIRIGGASAALYNTVDDCQFDGSSGGVQIDSTAQQTTLEKNHGPDFTVTDAGVGTRRRDAVLWTPIASPTYSASITPDASAGAWQTITVSNTTAFAINAPSNPPSSTATGELTVEIVNSSGGVMGAITWNAAFVFAGFTWTNPASTKKRFARFEWNGAAWVCTSLSSADY